MAEQTSARLVTPAFVALTLSDLAYFTAGGMLIAGTPLFVTGPLSSGEAGVGLAMGSFSLTTLVLRPLAGRWTDRRGRRALFVGGAAAFAVVALGHLAVSSLEALVVLRMVLGAAEAAYFVAGVAALADLAPAGRAGEALSLNSLALYAGMALGPLLGQALLETSGFDAVWVGAVVLAAVAALLALRVPETRGEVDADAPPSPLVHGKALLPGFALFCGVAAMAGFLGFAALQARAAGIERWSLVLFLFGGTVIVCRIVFARLPDRVGALPVAAWALATSSAGFLLIGVVETSGGLLIGAFILGVGTAFLTPAVFALVFSSVPAAERGSAAATTSVFIDLGLGSGPLLVGLVAGSTSIPDAFLVTAALPALGSLVLLRRLRRMHRRSVLEGAT